MKMKVLLTGGSGTVGKEALQELLRRKEQYEVRVFDLNTPSNRKIYKPWENQIEIVYGDITRPEQVEPAAQGVDAVIHTAALIPPVADHQPVLAKAINADGTLNLIQAMEKHSPEAFLVYTSSVSLYGDRVNNPLIKVTDPIQPSEGDYYAVTKIMAEENVRASQLRWTIFRLAGIFSDTLKPDPLMFHMPLDTCLEFASARDTGYAMVQSLDKQDVLEGNTYNLGGGKNCQMRYKDFLNTSFEQFGLGRDLLPEEAFATQNFHCGYYEDGHLLNDLLHFQRDTKEAYFQWMRSTKGPVIRFLAGLSRPIVRWSLVRQSEPLQARRRGDKKMIERYYGS